MIAKSFIGAAFAAVLFSFSSAEAATYVDFSISGTGDPTTTFVLPLSPTPDESITGVNGYFVLRDVPVVVNGTPTTDVLVFTNTGSFGLEDSLYYVVAGQYYTGSEDSPTFLTGVYSNEHNFDSGHDDTVSISIATAPLPSTWTMLIAGFLALGFFSYRGSKKNAAALAAA